MVAPRSAIAVAVLQDVEIDHPALAAGMSQIAIVGSIATENLGVEHLVKNVIANPFIRHLILWGNDPDGHLPGNALLQMKRNGVDATGRIIGAQGARPVLKNITRGEVLHFREQLQVVDLIGETEIAELAQSIEALVGQERPPFKAGLRVQGLEIEKAEPARRLKFDPSGYFVIMVATGKEQPLLVEHYSSDGRIRHMIAGKDAASLCATLIEKKLVSRLDHAAYLGRELAKAEMALGSGSTYTQDRAQGELRLPAETPGSGTVG